jgi:hypothetical protein
MLQVELLYIEDNVTAVVSVDGVIERYDIKTGREDYIEVPDRDGALKKYFIYELKEEFK